MNLKEILNRHYPENEPIAVIGYACRFPEAIDSEAYWKNLLEGRECNRQFSRKELLGSGASPDLIDDPAYVPFGTVIEGAENFDAALFGYSRQEAELIDPQQRLFLQLVWHALENSGYAPRSVPHKTGVYAATRISTYVGQEPIKVAEVAHVRNLQSLMGNDKDYLATRVAYKLNLHGPALTVQTACSSSLVATHLACESLRAGECDMAIAGGVAVAFPQISGYLFREGMIFSPDGHCRPFDVNAHGTYVGNGAGVVVLRRLSDALREGDQIKAVVLGSSVNNDGSQKVGYTAPSMVGQRNVIGDAWVLAGVCSQQIGMMEAHGTATPLGDSIEVQALHSVFHKANQGPACALGSVKSNMGHLDTAAGIASFLKAVLAVECGIIPPSANFSQANPVLRLEDGPFYVPTQKQVWSEQERIAGVSSFGIGGTNCHMVVASLPVELQQWTKTDVRPLGDASALLFSANSETALRHLADGYVHSLEHFPASNVAFSALRDRQLDMPWRLAVPVCDETADALLAFSNGDKDILVHVNHETSGSHAWMFTGQGAQWPGMASSWYAHSEAFAQCVQECLTIFQETGDEQFVQNLRKALLEDDHTLFQCMEYVQPAIVVFELAMSAYWKSLGLMPDMVLGHSVGEYAAAVVAGYYTPQQILPLVRLRGALMDRCGSGGMLSVFAHDSEVMPLAVELGLDLAAYNGVRHLVFSGENDLIASMASRLSEQGIHSNPLNVTGATHSRMLDPILDEFALSATAIHAKEGTVPFISGLTGESVDADQLNTGNFWGKHLRSPVRFIQCLRKAVEEEAVLFLEMGPDSQLSGIGKRELGDVARWIGCAKRFQPADQQFVQAMMQLFCAGINLKWASLLGSSGRSCVLPVYPFDQQRYWREAEHYEVQNPVLHTESRWVSARKIVLEGGQTLELDRLEAIYACVIKLHAIYVDQLVRACVGERIDQGVKAIDILRNGRLLPRYQQLLMRLLNSCAEDGYLKVHHDLYTSSLPIPHHEHADLLKEFRSYCEGLDVIAETVERAGSQLYGMMSGQIEPVSVIFPEGTSSGVEVLYQDFSFGRYFNQIAAGVLSDLIRAWGEQSNILSTYRVLEVGGGTGGTTSWLLPKLAGLQNVRYVFTDISPIFTRRAEKKFSEYEFIEYREFDLQKRADVQNLVAGSFDLIVAANVIHATQHVQKTLENLLLLLKPGGKLLMREITKPMRLFDFVFGPLVTPLQDIEQRGGELFLTTARWREQCLAAGFSQIEWLPEDSAKTASMGEHIVLATAPNVAASVRENQSMRLDDGLLGQALSNDGGYLVDWSDCAGQQKQWHDRIRLASMEIARRHGNGIYMPLADVPFQAPSWLKIVRLTWCVELMQTPQIAISVCAPDGVWHDISNLNTAGGAESYELRSSVLNTQYDWSWSRIDFERISRTDRFQLHSKIDEKIKTDFAKVGITLIAEANNWLILVPRAADSLETMVEPLLAAVRQLTAVQPKHIIVVTRNAWAIEKSDRIDAMQHAVWGLVRVAAIEYGIQGHVISAVDIGEDGSWHELAFGLQVVTQGTQWIAVRSDEIWIPRLMSQKYIAPTLGKRCLASEQWHVITGGLGGLGRVSAKWLASRGAKRIALLVRSEHADARQFIADVEQKYGCSIKSIVCDVSEVLALNETLDQLQLDADVAGVIHAAGLLADDPISSMDTKRLKSVLNAKAYSARHIYEWLKKQKNKSYLLFYSSAAAALGSAGQAAHALASGYLDGLAREADGLQGDCSQVAVISIAWGAWGESGHVSDFRLQQRLINEGMELISDDEGAWHLEQAFARSAPYRLAMRVQPERLDESRKRLLGLAPSVLFFENKMLNTGPCRNLEHQTNVVGLSPDELLDVGKVAQWLTVQIARQLRLDELNHLLPKRDLVQMGLDSLLFLELSSLIQQKLGVNLDAERAYRELTINGLSQLIVEQANLPKKFAAEISMLTHDAEGRYEPFPLTPIQHAYWVGRTNLIEYGGVACHVLFEWDLEHSQFDLVKIEDAWNALIQRHDMLRMVVDEDGQQRILAKVPNYRIERHDLSVLETHQLESELERIRAQLSHRVPPADCWPLFDLCASDWGGKSFRLHMNLDLLMFDVQSFKVMMDDLAAFYQGLETEPLQITFRDYILGEQARRHQADWLKSWSYWQERLLEMPPAPRLALTEQPPTSEQPHLVSYQSKLDREDWGRLKSVWKMWGVTPSAGLMTLFAWTLERWARWPAFTLNLTFFNRRAVHPQINQLIGDFTSVLLVDFNLNDSASTLRTSIEKTQQRLWESLANSQVNGVELLREIGRVRNQSRQPLTPVVFTSMLGMTLDGLSIDKAMTNFFGNPTHVFTQTPQVWLDHQVMEIDDELVFSWYCMDEVFANNAAESMFGDFYGLLKAVAKKPELMEHSGLWKLNDDRYEPECFNRQSWPATVADVLVDLRDIENVILQQEDVQHAEVQVNEVTGELLAKIAATERTYSFDELPGGVLTELSKQMVGLDNTQQAQFDNVWRALESRALKGICRTFLRHGLFVQIGQSATFGEIFHGLSILPKFERIIRQWLRVLVEAGCLAQQDHLFVCRQMLADVPEGEKAPASSWGDVLIDYLDQSIERHSDLLQGKCSALELFFVDDDAVTQALYAENLAAQCIVQNMKQVIKTLLHQLDDVSLSVLEVGAGTATTTGPVLEVLGERLHTYCFTDVSTFFLNEARKRFNEHECIAYEIFDINQPVDYSKHPIQGYDLVVAAQVIHDASHIVRSLQRIGSLMKPGARLVLIESTHRDSLFQMASVGFLEGLGNYQDLRIVDDKSMLNLAQWRDALQEAGFFVEFMWPEQDISPIHQHLIVARLIRAAHVDCAYVKQLLFQNFDGKLPNITVSQCESVNLFRIESADNKRVGASSFLECTLCDETEMTIEKGDETHTDLMDRVAQVWQSFLGRPVYAQSDFFRCGGDSLIATRVVAQLNRIGIAGVSLQALFSHPRLNDFCATLNQAKRWGMERVLVPLTQGGSEEHIFAFHASDGGVASYLKLSQSLSRTVFGLQAPESIGTNSLLVLAQEYCRIVESEHGSAPLVLIGWSYGATVAAEVARMLHDRRQSVRLILIDPVCGADFVFENLSDLMFRLSLEHAIVLPDDWDLLQEDARVEAFIRQAVNIGFLEQSIPTAVARQWLIRIFQLLSLLSAHRLSSHVSIPTLWIEAAERPKQWAPAVREWGAWKTQAESYTVNATHWQLMQDEETVSQVCHIVQQWLAEKHEPEQLV